MHLSCGEAPRSPGGGGREYVGRQSQTAPKLMASFCLQGYNSRSPYLKIATTRIAKMPSLRLETIDRPPRVAKAQARLRRANLKLSPPELQGVAFRCRGRWYHEVMLYQ